MHENQQSHIEGIFSRGDRRVADVLEAAFRLGCRFDGWDDALRIELWDRAIAETAARTGIEVDRYLGTMPVTARLPWDHIDIGLEPDFLAQGVPQGAQGSAVAAVRQAVQEAAAPEQRRRRRGGRGREADLLRLRHRLRSRRDEGRAALLSAAHERLAARRRPSRRCAEPDATRAGATADHAAAARARRRGRRTGTACATPSSAGWPSSATSISSRHLPRIFRRAGLRAVSTRWAFTPSPSCRTGRRSGSGSRRWASCCDVTLVDERRARRALAAARARHPGRHRVPGGGAPGRRRSRRSGG